MNYTDRFGQWHKNPVVGQDPDGQHDGMILSAYADKLGLVGQPDNYSVLFNSLRRHEKYRYPVERYPGLETPYPSRDFFLGAAYFRLVAPYSFAPGWNFSPLPLPRLNLFKLIYQLWQCRGQDRHYFWKNKLDQVYHLAFMVPLHDRAFYYHRWGMRVPLVYSVIAWIDQTYFKPKGGSSKRIRWLKYGIPADNHSWLAYFGREHPFTQRVLGRRQ
jgi:hypothetical protein